MLRAASSHTAHLAAWPTMTLASGEASAAGQQRVEVKMANSCQAVWLCSDGWLAVEPVVLAVAAVRGSQAG